MDIEPEKILATVRDPSVARALLRHERRNWIENTSGAYYHRVPPARQHSLASGLLPRLNAVYWPHTNFRNIKKTPRKKEKRGRRKKKKVAGGGRFAGLIKGSKVHEELKSFVLYDARAFQKTHRNVHPYTMRLMQAIVALRHWTPLVPEFDIFDEALGIATSIDQIAVDRDGNLILLEVKTGYRDTFDAPDGFMQHALARLPNTMRNRASMQVAVAALILNRRYDVPLERMKLYVLRIDDAETQIIAVPDGLLQRLGEAIYQDLLRYNNERH